MNIVITGATGTIGSALIKKIDLHRRDENIYITGRNTQKLNSLSVETGNRIVPYHTDLSLKDEIDWFISVLPRNIDILINIAATAPIIRTQNQYGEEMQFAVNLLSYYRLCTGLIRRMRPGARIVNVSSQYVGDLDFADLQFKHRPYDNRKAYRQSKLGVRMITKALSVAPEFQHVDINSIHPGGVSSELTACLNIGADDTAETGADSIYNLAFNPELKGLTGEYFEYKERVPCSLNLSTQACQALIEILKTYQ